jgi:hypothetical protein
MKEATMKKIEIVVMEITTKMSNGKPSVLHRIYTDSSSAVKDFDRIKQGLQAVKDAYWRIQIYTPTVDQYTNTIQMMPSGHVGDFMFIRASYLPEVVNANNN